MMENQTNTGYLHIGNDTRGIQSLFMEQGDAYFDNNVAIVGSLFSYAPPYGIAYLGLSEDTEFNITSLGGTATVNATTQYICDSTDPFSEGNEGMFLTVIDSNPSYTGATGEIIDYVNETCIRISFASAGSRTVVDAESMTYFVYPHPIFAVLDNGFITTEIGNNPDTKFEIHIPNGTGFQGVYIEDTAGANQHQSLTIDTDIRNFDGIVGLNNYIYSSTGATNIRASNQLLELDFTGINDSHFDFIDMKIINLGTNGNDIDALHISPNVDHIIEMGSEDEIIEAWYINGTDAINITDNLLSDTSDVELFSNDDDFVYVGSDVNFTTISFSLEQVSSHNLGSKHYYCNTTGGWETLEGVTGTTNGLKVSGTISFTNPSNRGKCNESVNGFGLGATNLSYIGIKRTTNFIVIPPIENLVSVGGGSDLFLLQKDLMKLNPVETAPETCDANMLGAIYWDISEDSLCQCASGGWKVIHDNSECT